jgi:hypothetical protein
VLLNHVLIGGRVEWRGDLWIVTGAKREEGSEDCAFRLLPLNAGPPRDEVWTEPRPTFGEVAAVRVLAERECCGTLPGSRHRSTCEHSKPQNAKLGGPNGPQEKQR